ncbi:MAG: peptide chain release factor N(5)-glutamine methyltransferase, partial [Paracoccaceae bacterium]
MTGAEALRRAIPRLTEAGVEGAARDARRLLAHAMGLPAERLSLHLHDGLNAAQEA